MNTVSMCGKLVIGGFSGKTLPRRYAQALKGGRRGGAILFAGNVSGGREQIASLAQQIQEAQPGAFLGVDQEGGRVARLREPFLTVPPMRTVASWGDLALAERIASAVGRELAGLGFTINFAPVLDTNTCPRNPIIGDRAFSDDPDVCARFGAAWIRGLQAGGVLATGKHFPGHGDTSSDSHLELPRVDLPRERLERVELAPFVAAIQAGVAALMTAHVVYPAWDPDRPATLSRAICTDLRNRLGFDGLLVSDDLEMKAIAAHHGTGEAAVLSVAAGCDVLLVCHDEDAQDEAVDALIHEAETSQAFRDQCALAEARVQAAKRRLRSPPRQEGAVSEDPASERRWVVDEMARRLAR